jgi:hypothetical protein
MCLGKLLSKAEFTHLRSEEEDYSVRQGGSNFTQFCTEKGITRIHRDGHLYLRQILAKF